MRQILFRRPNGISASVKPERPTVMGAGIKDLQIYKLNFALSGATISTVRIANFWCNESSGDLQKPLHVYKGFSAFKRNIFLIMVMTLWSSACIVSKVLLIHCALRVFWGLLIYSASLDCTKNMQVVPHFGKSGRTAMLRAGGNMRKNCQLTKYVKLTARELIHTFS